MSQPIFQQLQHGQELSFNEVQRLIGQLGFRQVSLSRLHFIYAHDKVRELLSLQNADGKVKSWQLRQILYLVQKYQLEEV
ncbi:hypothetical protein COW36_05995 [bacterium (Candidatus Blackallbacteria) CG17_big_fil_post_rev_8_21_14_2_50_48_46]|uniref:Toxin HicA n=1 Tax=bacterium (Candidatus Blackallbacteria) CG17_big_fil_post_rev_8_21_14_2_50_48_46 TaxID=2014261 RepID=A0A2M7G7L5_9BACT|nr:MAG: hypothetical protein COW64_16825 [bacterium (Candidatus Blackallbacteria) CG18_big_fil_WC_8_21_14_2_50_49_26]PIW18080.1 MAG: hypothetical protein COW36_05995 [bacterium (Candidatus Blackallbacteria) CG17_big_fil_post_rev_8_21_14_2_50_48_46]PIW51089.1 MAG: hypothetical protein COW20_00145 [bacterium (Candidatus Blackallbacteria) CG13_big_fil_rev_8_21_14_2_50_49_14]